MTNDLSTLLDKGTSSTVVNQVVYNPVEMKKALTVPSVQGASTTVAGSSINSFSLGGTVTNNALTSMLTLHGYKSGASTLADVCKMRIIQNGSIFYMEPGYANGTSYNSLGFDPSIG